MQDMTKHLLYSPQTTAKIGRHIERLSPAPTPHFIGIWGASGSGKSTFAKELATLLLDSTIFPIDHYLSANLAIQKFHHISPNPAVPYIEGLDPNIWDQPLLNSHLSMLERQIPIEIPLFNHKERKRSGSRLIMPHKIILIEGAYALENIVASSLSTVIILDCPFHDRFIRKLVRTARVTKRNDLDESIERYISRTEPATAYYIRTYSRKADYVVQVNSQPRKEFKRFAKDDVMPHPQEGMTLTPKETSGALHDEEFLFVTTGGSGTPIKLIYCIDNKRVFEATISKKSLDLLSLHYNFV